MKRPPRRQPQRSWAEICCLGDCIQHFWPKVVLRKWLNIPTTESDFSADTDDGGDADFNSDDEEGDETWFPQSRLGIKNADEDPLKFNEIPSKPHGRARRSNSETYRAQYINTKELRIFVGTWNVGGKLPPEDFEIDEWLDIDEPSDIYVLGFQEVVPLNAGNVLGAEDSRPAPRWEYIIRDTLNKVRPLKTKFKCYSDPPSPSKLKPLENIPDVEDELIHTESEGDEEACPLDETDSGRDEEKHPLNEEYSHFEEIEIGRFARENKFISSRGSKVSDDMDIHTPFQRQSSFLKKFDNLTGEMEGIMEEPVTSVTHPKGRLTKTCSMSERMTLSWPDPPINLLAQRVLETPKSFRPVKSFRASKPFRKSNSFSSHTDNDNKETSEIALLAELDLESIIRRKRRSPFVRIASKQMVGVFVSIWARRSLRRHIQNLKVSTVGVGVMGYIGNKGSVSVSMSIYQTLFCFICTHLTSGEKHGDELRRNADVREIHRRTRFHPASNNDFQMSIHDHEKIIWFGDLNYRINLPYETTRELISRKEWSKLAEKDQLIRELKKGRVFDGWTEGALNFPPTYKYEFNSQRYCGEDPKSGRRNPAWCDRILSFGKGMRLLKYSRVEQLLSDHRPVKAIYMAEVEVFSLNKLQKALALTVAELLDKEFPKN